MSKQEYARQTATINTRIGKQYKTMLKELSIASKQPMSWIVRNILEDCISRRYKRGEKKKKKS